MSTSRPPSNSCGPSWEEFAQLQVRNAVLETDLAHAKKQKEDAVNSSILIIRSFAPLITPLGTLSSSSSKPQDTESNFTKMRMIGNYMCCEARHEAHHELIDTYKQDLKDANEKIVESQDRWKERLNKLQTENDDLHQQLQAAQSSQELSQYGSMLAKIQFKDNAIHKLKEKLKEAKRRNEKFKAGVVSACGVTVQDIISKVSMVDLTKKYAAMNTRSDVVTEGPEDKSKTEHDVPNVEISLVQEPVDNHESSLIGTEYTSASNEISFTTTTTEKIIYTDESAQESTNNSSEDADMIDLEAILDEAQDISDEPRGLHTNMEHSYNEIIDTTSEVNTGETEAGAKEIEQMRAARSSKPTPGILSVGFEAPIQPQEEELSAEARWKIYSRPQAPRRYKCGDFIDPTFDAEKLWYDPPETEEHPNRAVLISNLPSNITVGEVLDRVRGGMILEAFLAPSTSLIGCNSAYIRFLHGTSAERYTDFCERYLQTIGGKVASVELVPTPTHPCNQTRWRGIKHFSQSRVLEVKNIPSDLTIRDMECDIAACSSTGALQKYYEMLFVGEGEQRKLKILCNSVERAVELMRSMRQAAEMSGLNIIFGEDPCRGWVEELIDSSQKVAGHASEEEEIQAKSEAHLELPSSYAIAHVNTNSTTASQFLSAQSAILSTNKSESVSWADEVNEATETGTLALKKPGTTAEMPSNNSTSTPRKIPASSAARRYITSIPRFENDINTHRPKAPSTLRTSFSTEDLSSEHEADDHNIRGEPTGANFEVLGDNPHGNGQSQQADEDHMPLTPLAVPLPLSPPDVEQTSDSFIANSDDHSAGGGSENKENTPPRRNTNPATIETERVTRAGDISNVTNTENGRSGEN